MRTNPTWSLRPLAEGELDSLYTRRIAEDFPSDERPSLPAMHRHMQNGLQQILMMTDGEEDAAYAVCAEANGIVLVSLLAVFADRRGGGHGSRLLALLKEQYAGARAIVLEVEDPKDAEDAAAVQTREKRIAFYERNGYHFLEGIRHDSFGVHLLVMATPLGDALENIRATAVEDLRAIYHRILPEHLWEYVTTKEMA